MHEWRQRLAPLRDAVDASVIRLDFIPSEHWNPLAVGKGQWRDCPFGSHKEKVVPRIGRKKGPEDRRGRVWAWDTAHHNHWDVQHEHPLDDRRMNVTPDGTITRRYGA
jgi:hypothetical protein